VEFLGMGTA